MVTQPAISAGVISELVSLLQVHFGPRLSAVYLCREPIFDAGDSSDLELLAVLDEPVDPAAEIWDMGRALSDFSVEHSSNGVGLSFQPAGIRRGQLVLRAGEADGETRRVNPEEAFCEKAQRSIDSAEV